MLLFPIMKVQKVLSSFLWPEVILPLRIFPALKIYFSTKLIAVEFRIPSVMPALQNIYEVFCTRTDGIRDYFFALSLFADDEKGTMGRFNWRAKRSDRAGEAITVND